MFEPLLHHIHRNAPVCPRLSSTINAPTASAKGTAPQPTHITSRWYSSPDCAPAAILDPWIATHCTGLGA